MKAPAAPTTNKKPVTAPAQAADEINLDDIPF